MKFSLPLNSQEEKFRVKWAFVLTICFRGKNIDFFKENVAPGVLIRWVVRPAFHSFFPSPSQHA